MIETVMIGILVIAGAIWLASCGDSPTKPSPPQPLVCTLVHHPETRQCTTIFTGIGPILYCTITPAQDGPDEECK